MRSIVKYIKTYCLYCLKRLFFLMLRTPLFTKSPLYRLAYNRKIRRRRKLFEQEIGSVQIENTNCCNISCVFCPNDTMTRKRGFMDKGLFRDIVRQCSENKVKRAIISGFGDPLLDKNYVEEVKYAKERGIDSVECVTNGILLTENVSEALMEVKLDSIFISVDAASVEVYGEIHKNINSNTPCDKYDLVVENIRKLGKLKKQHGKTIPQVQVRFKDFAMNRGQLRKFAKIFSRLADEINVYMNIFHWPGSSVESNILKRWPVLKFPCYNLWAGLYICYDGRVALCCQDYECKVELGDLKKESMADIWCGERLSEIRRMHLAERYSELHVCSDCTINTHYVTPWWPS